MSGKIVLDVLKEDWGIKHYYELRGGNWRLAFDDEKMKNGDVLRKEFTLPVAVHEIDYPSTYYPEWSTRRVVVHGEVKDSEDVILSKIHRAMANFNG